MRRMLLYSLERMRPIRMIFMQEEAMRQVNCVVTALNDKSATVRILRPQQDAVIDLNDILSVDYKKGDDGNI